MTTEPLKTETPAPVPSTVLLASIQTQTLIKRTPWEILLEWRSRIAEHRFSEQSTQRHGMPDLSKWHEGQADALERAADELEYCILPHTQRANQANDQAEARRNDKL